MHMVDSPFVIPLGAFLVAIVAIVAGVVSKMHAERTRADQRLAMLAQGVPLQDVERLLGTNGVDVERLLETHGVADQARPRSPWNPTRSAAMMRRTALILISTGLGITAFFVALALILHESDIYSGAAVGLIPMFIGVGFLADYRLQMRDLVRLRQETTP